MLQRDRPVLVHWKATCGESYSMQNVIFVVFTATEHRTGRTLFNAMVYRSTDIIGLCLERTMEDKRYSRWSSAIYISRIQFDLRRLYLVRLCNFELLNRLRNS